MTVGVNGVAQGGTGAVTLAGSDTSETTTTSTGTTDLLSVTALTIAAAAPMWLSSGFRKTTGAADDGRWHYDLNDTTQGNQAAGTTANSVQNYRYLQMYGARVTNYDDQAHMFQINSNDPPIERISNAPIVEITHIEVAGLTQNSNITMGADELHIYVCATS